MFLKVNGFLKANGNIILLYVILTKGSNFGTSCLLPGSGRLTKLRPTLKRKNLLSTEQILSFHSWSQLRREAKRERETFGVALPESEPLVYLKWLNSLLCDVARLCLATVDATDRFSSVLLQSWTRPGLVILEPSLSVPAKVFGGNVCFNNWNKHFPKPWLEYVSIESLEQAEIRFLASYGDSNCDSSALWSANLIFS